MIGRYLYKKRETLNVYVKLPHDRWESHWLENKLDEMIDVDRIHPNNRVRDWQDVVYDSNELKEKLIIENDSINYVLRVPFDVWAVALVATVVVKGTDRLFSVSSFGTCVIMDDKSNDLFVLFIGIKGSCFFFDMRK